MARGNNTGFHCPHCGAPAAWDVDQCEACGYRSPADQGWVREARRKERAESARGCLGSSLDFFVIDGLVELGALLVRGLFALARAIWAVLT